jgi:hypothetical protein
MCFPEIRIFRTTFYLQGHYIDLITSTYHEGFLSCGIGLYDVHDIRHGCIQEDFNAHVFSH